MRTLRSRQLLDPTALLKGYFTQKLQFCLHFTHHHYVSRSIRVGPIDDAIVHRQWLIDITMLSWHRDPPPYPPQSAASQYRVWKENDVYYGTPKGNKYEMGGKIHISIHSLAVISLGIYTVVYIIACIREPLLWLALKLLLNAQTLFSFTFTFEIRDRTSYSVYTMERQYLPHILQD